VIIGVELALGGIPEVKHPGYLRLNVRDVETLDLADAGTPIDEALPYRSDPRPKGRYQA
jgi:hypothetical protein